MQCFGSALFLMRIQTKAKIVLRIRFNFKVFFSGGRLLRAVFFSFQAAQNDFCSNNFRGLISMAIIWRRTGSTIFSRIRIRPGQKQADPDPKHWLKVNIREAGCSMDHLKTKHGQCLVGSGASINEFIIFYGQLQFSNQFMHPGLPPCWRVRQPCCKVARNFLQ